MSKQEVILLSKDNYKLSLLVFNAEKPKANIIMVHGMEEHKERYIDFATFLQNNHYNVIVSDLRGHGSNAPLLSHISDKYGDELLIEDERIIREYVKREFPDLPIYLFAHSMGTIISRVLLQEDSKEYAKVALSGYVNPNPASGVGLFLTKFIKLFKGPKGHSKLITNLAVGQFSKKIKNRKTPLDWLSFDEKNVQNYIADPLSGVEFTLGSYVALFSLMKKMGKPKRYHNINKELPFLLIGGEEDPSTGYEKGRKDSYNNLIKAGFTKIEVETLKHMRHEILNETDKQKVYEDILTFFNK